jgi:hypothetical protein
MKYFWLAISLIMHPLLLITYAYAIMFYFLPYYKARFYEEEPQYLILYVFSNTFFLPVLALFVLKKIKMVQSFLLNERAERFYPYFLTTIFCGITSWQLYHTNIGALSYKFMIGITLVIGFITVINLKFKISSHAAGIAGVLALLTYFIVFLNESDMIIWLLGAIVLAGLSAASRLALGVHTFKEIYWGFLLGFITVFISVAI